MIGYYQYNVTKLQIHYSVCKFISMNEKDKIKEYTFCEECIKKEGIIEHIKDLLKEDKIKELKTFLEVDNPNKVEQNNLERIKDAYSVFMKAIKGKAKNIDDCDYKKKYGSEFRHPFYHIITGYYNELWFNVCFACLESKGIGREENTSIISMFYATECKNDIREILSDFEDLIELDEPK